METQTVQIAISANTLATLLKSGSLHAVDFTCLDADSKKTVWQLLLSSVQLAIPELNHHQFSASI
jgi:hypothetical protein